MKIFIIDINDMNYLNYLAICLKKKGVVCELKLDSGIPKGNLKIFHLKFINDNGEKICLECKVGKLDLSKAVQQIVEWEEQIKESSYVISVIPVKWFPALRYNIDNQWNGIEEWIHPKEYKRILNTTFNSQKTIWIFQGMENLGFMGSFFLSEGNEPAIETFWDNNIRENFNEKEMALQEVVKGFLKAIDEPRFYEDSSENMFFGFNSSRSMNCAIGEKTREFWCLYSMDDILKSVDLTL